MCRVADEYSKIKKLPLIPSYPVSATMIGICITVITLFKVTNVVRKINYADQVLCFDTLLFILSCFLSYISIRKNHNGRLKIIADFFFLGLIIMVFIGFLIVKIE